jgi:phage host-nuclease inhibitor protein Gam
MSAPLYALSGQYLAVQERAEAGEDVADLLEALHGDIEHKAAALVRLARDLELDSDKVAEEQRRLAARKKAIDNNVERLREYLRTNMLATGIHRVKAATFSIALSDGPERVDVVDETLVPEAFVRTKREVDKAKVLAAYKAHGELVAGTSITRGTRLVIR